MIPGATRIGARSTEPCGYCYRVLLWERSAIPHANLDRWKTESEAIHKRFRAFGEGSTVGEIRKAGEELRDLKRACFEAPLVTLTQAVPSYTRADEGAGDALAAMAARLDADERVQAYRLHPRWADLLVTLTDESIEEMTAPWKAAAAGIQWHADHFIDGMDAAAAYEWWKSDRKAVTAREAEEEAAKLAQKPFHHVTVLAHEAVELLQPAEGRVFVDATLGGGGHSGLMLQGGATVYGIDQDPHARAAARKRLATYGDRLHVVAGNFRHVRRLLAGQGVERIDGLLADIGVSSPQVDNAERGFSFINDGPLDMRMNPAAGRSAADIVATASEEELADIFWSDGEERASRAIARRIVQERGKAPITTTKQLADIIASVLPRKGKQHPATRCFQALRIHVNDELAALGDLLGDALGLLTPGGRLAVITFHSLEDRIVKRFFEKVTKPEIDRPEWPAPRPNPEYAAKLITRKPVTAGAAELAANPRSRSAKLRVIEKI